MKKAVGVFCAICALFFGMGAISGVLPRSAHSAIVAVSNTINTAKPPADIKADRISLIDKRMAFTNTTESTYLLRGMDVHLEVRGANADTFYMKYALLGRPDVYQFINNQHLMANMKQMGFKRAILTDGYDKTWNLDLAAY